MWVGSNLIIPDKEYVPLEIVVMALELISASKRSPGSDTPHGNTELPRTWAVLSKCTPEQVIMDQTWVCLLCIQNDVDLL